MKLSDFLKKHNVYGKFIDYSLADSDTNEKIIEGYLDEVDFNNAFFWVETSEGYEFWRNLDDLFRSLKERIYDMTDILYKEYIKRNFKNSNKDTITLKGKKFKLIPVEEDITDKLLEIKNKFNTGSYYVMFKQKCVNSWDYCYRPKDLTWRRDFDYKLIHIIHKDILEEYIKDKSIKIEFNYNPLCKHNKWVPIGGDFIDNYNEIYYYRISNKFEPFVFKIKVETLDDLKSLINRFNLSNIQIKDTLKEDKATVYDVQSNVDFGVYVKLKEIMKDYEGFWI